VKYPVGGSPSGRKKTGEMVKTLFIAISRFLFLMMLLTVCATAQDVIPTPFFTSFFDSTFSSTYNGQLLPVGSIIGAFDPSGVFCGVDTVRTEGTFGFMPVYGDDPLSTGVDEGAEAGENISFKINGIDAVVTAGDSTWADDRTNRSITILATPLSVAISPITLPSPLAVAPGGTGTLQVDVRNDGNGLDFYGVKLTMSIDDTVSNPDNFNWKKFEPDSLVYADPGETVSVFFSIQAPLFSSDTVNNVSYTVFSNVDTTVTVTGAVDIFMSITDVDDPRLSLPGAFTLAQNYPNPFNPSTTIAFNLSSRSAVSFDVFDALGRRVQHRDLGSLPAGPHEVEYESDGLSSGVYFYRLISESMSETKKMVLLK